MELGSKNRIWIGGVLEESISGSSDSMDFRVFKVDASAQIGRHAVGK